MHMNKMPDTVIIQIVGSLSSQVFSYFFQTIQLFFHLRRFTLDLRDEEETRLPISSETDVFVEINDCINLG